MKIKLHSDLEFTCDQAEESFPGELYLSSWASELDLIAFKNTTKAFHLVINGKLVDQILLDTAYSGFTSGVDMVGQIKQEVSSLGVAIGSIQSITIGRNMILVVTD